MTSAAQFVGTATQEWKYRNDSVSYFRDANLHLRNILD